ncbi:hypothetical protein A3G98_00350 [Candidatus Nomurabacteria bacterium RIFCSPLOWO2_12_FULL_37_8]|uniref:Vitamin K epoxide reductase domain-containing protein n=1 Tax=Candidatus Nomurabacteria bacterium RIFCSPLOWO2_12_FULL_37_8 TaxID=1801793 RepID=A0A1F6Y2Q5_9BACT|nr:MAG: hypothetical protein A3G98_00350 [Candidatus Nomurabacteria bacterium RIFCSPLOWO2_12_FULL_37_8]
MLFSNEVLLRIIIFILGLCGFMVAKHIRNHKTKNTPLVCLVGFDCHNVVHSDYSKFLGIPVELFGMIYYSFISIAYFFLIFMPSAVSLSLIFYLIVMSLVALLFSIYLITIQIFILKKGCSWCIVSAIISSLIFVLAMLN